MGGGGGGHDNPSLERNTLLPSAGASMFGCAGGPALPMLACRSPSRVKATPGPEDRPALDGDGTETCLPGPLIVCPDVKGEAKPRRGPARP